MRRGARDNWVRTGISWTDVPYLDRRGAHPPAQVARAQRPAVAGTGPRCGRSTSAPTAHLSLGSFGPDEVSLLRRAVAAGIPLLAGRRAVPRRGRARPGDAPARRQRRPGPRRPAAARGARSTASGTAPPTSTCSARAGTPWRCGWPTADALVGDAGGADRPARARGAPAAQARRLGASCRRRTATTWSRSTSPGCSGTSRCSPPTGRSRCPSRPSRGSRSPSPGWRSTRCAPRGRWRYRVGADDRVYALSETRGLRGVRRPDAGAGAARRAGARRRAGAPPLPRAPARAWGSRTSKTFRDAHAILFAERAAARAARARSRSTRSATSPTTASSQGAPVIHFATRDGADARPGRAPTGSTSRSRSPSTARTSRWRTCSRRSPRAWTGSSCATARTCASTGPSSRTSPSWSRRPRELQEQPDDGVRVGHHDLGLWDELAEVGHRRRAGGAVGPGGPGAARPWTRCPRSTRSGSRRSCGPTSSTGSAGWPSSGSPGSAGSSPTTWGSARRCRPWRWSRTPAATGPAPFLVVAPTSVVGDLGARGRARSRPASTSGRSPSRRPGAATSVARRWPTGADVVVTSYTLLRLEADDYVALDVGRPGARRGADGQEPPAARPTRRCAGSTCRSGSR